MKYPQFKGLSVKEYKREWRKINGIKTIKGMHELRFGGLRESVLARDKYKCVMCGMTLERHLRLFNRSLTINHINGLGRHLTNIGLLSDNRIDNLETLCLRCHGHIDGLKSRGIKRLHKINN